MSAGGMDGCSLPFVVTRLRSKLPLVEERVGNPCVWRCQSCGPILSIVYAHLWVRDLRSGKNSKGERGNAIV